jgi:hypothetical protein
MRKFLRFILIGAMTFAMCVPAAADGLVFGLAPDDTPHAVAIYGTVTAKDGDRITVANYQDENDLVILNVSETTPVLDAETALPSKGDLVEGAYVAAYYGPITTMSIPPQSVAVAILTNFPENEPGPVYSVIENAEKADGGVRLLTEYGAVILTVNADTQLLPYLTREFVTEDMLTAGTEIVAWYLHNILALSYPSQAAASRIVVLSYGETGEESEAREPDEETPDEPAAQPDAPSASVFAKILEVTLESVTDTGKPQLLYEDLAGTDPPFVYGLVHVKTFCDFVGAITAWDDDTKTATLTGVDSAGSNVTVKLVSNGSDIEINGETFDMGAYVNAPEDQAGKYVTLNVNDSLYLPFRAVGYAFKSSIKQDPDTKAVTITFAAD